MFTAFLVFSPVAFVLLVGSAFYHAERRQDRAYAKAARERDARREAREAIEYARRNSR